MAIPVIIMGACGRMGGTLTRLAKEDSSLHLAGVCVLPEQQEQAAAYGCHVANDVAELLASTPQATVIDFTSPESSLATAKKVVAYGSMHVIGTTGFNEVQKKELEAFAGQTPMFWSPNMSVGINVLLKILPLLTEMLGDQYDVEMVETHHKMKKDSPSGTALRLAECLATAKGWNLPDVACYHREGIIGERPEKQIGLQTLRGGDVVGDHTIFYFGPGERIEVKHQAHSRENFAQGALRAALWLNSQKAGKLYTMQDVFQ